MKKLMMAVAVMATTIVANAAQITWESGAIKLANGSTAGAGDVTAYLFVIDASTYSSLLVNTTGATLSDAVWTSYGSDLASAKATQVSVKKGNKANLTDPADYADGKTAYAAILYVDKDGANYMGNIGAYTFDSSSDWSVEGMASFIGGGTSGTSTAWSTAAVPEPTSGLLMLLGMAGLALRRKRA